MGLENFTDDELTLLKAIFCGASAVIDNLKINNGDTYNSNLLFSVMCKLGIEL